MKYEDYEAQIKSMIANSDTAPEVAQNLLTELKADSETMASLEAGIAERDERINTLQRINTDQFMRLTGSAAEELEDDEDEIKTADELIDEIFGGKNDE